MGPKPRDAGMKGVVGARAAGDCAADKLDERDVGGAKG